MSSPEDEKTSLQPILVQDLKLTPEKRAEQIAGFEHIMPPWMKRGVYEVLPEIGVVTLGGLGPLKKGRAVVTRTLLEEYPQLLAEPDDLSARGVMDYYIKEDNIYFEASSRYPILTKKDPFRESPTTLLTLATIGKLLPEKAKDFSFQPLKLYWAYADGEKDSAWDYLVMERVTTHPPKTEREWDAYLKAYSDLAKLLDSKDSDISAGDMARNDVLFRGLDSQGKAIISLIDVQDRWIEDKVKQHTDPNYWSV